MSGLWKALAITAAAVAIIAVLPDVDATLKSVRCNSASED